MTVSSSTSDTRYAGNGATTVFASGFTFYDASTLRVSLVNTTTGVETVKTLTTDYTVTGGAGATGSITFIVAPPTGNTVVIQRTEPYSQLTSLGANDPLPAAVLQLTYDKLEMQIQQVYRRTLTAIQSPAGFDPNTAAPYTMPTPSNGMVLVGNTTNTGWSNSAILTLVGVLSVVTTLLADRDLLEYDNAGGVWRNQTSATVLGRVLTTRGDVLVRGASAPQRLAVGAANTFLQSNGTDVSWAILPQYTYAGVRQTVPAGPVDASGLPTFLPATNAALSITTQNVTSNTPLVASSANGWSGTTGLPVDALGYSVANFTWTGLTANRAATSPNYLYGTIAGGAITPLSTVLAPIYQWGGTPSVTSGQITFNISEMKAYLGNGTTAPQTNLVVFGEAATDATTVISTVAYAYNGQYESAYTATLPGGGTTTSANHNIGVYPRQRLFVAQCTSADAGFSVGEELDTASGLATGTTIGLSVTIATTNKSMAVSNATTNPWFVVQKSGANSAALTAANWKYKFVARRGW